jgi:pyruvate/2-oxoglutarate dehydrogenase complex dihydrolipoamide dehydrogenase (E3) component
VKNTGPSSLNRVAIQGEIEQYSFNHRAELVDTMGDPTQTSVPQDADSYLQYNVLDLLSLKNRVVVITGGARGIGLALGFAVAEVGGSVAIIDAAPSPHEHFEKLKAICKAEYYQCVCRCS